MITARLELRVSSNRLGELAALSTEGSSLATGYPDWVPTAEEEARALVDGLLNHPPEDSTDRSWE